MAFLCLMVRFVTLQLLVDIDVIVIWWRCSCNIEMGFRDHFETLHWRRLVIFRHWSHGMEMVVLRQNGNSDTVLHHSPLVPGTKSTLCGSSQSYDMIDVSPRSSCNERMASYPVQYHLSLWDYCLELLFVQRFTFLSFRMCDSDVGWHFA